MTRNRTTGTLLALAIAVVTTSALPVLADETAPAIDIQAMFSAIPDDLGGKRMTVVEVIFPPGVVVDSHRHPGSVFAYVLSGAVRSQLAGEDEPTIYQAGQSWYEPPGARHIVNDNPSPDEPARLLAILFGDDEAELLLPDHDY